MAIVTRKHGTVELLTGGTPVTVELKPGEGDMSLSGMEEGGWSAESVKDRGAHYEWVYTTEAEVSWSITIMHDGDLTDASVATALDAIHETGLFSGETSGETTGEVWTIATVKLTMVAHGVTHTMIGTNHRVTAEYSETETGNTLSISGRGFGEVARTSA